MSLAAFFAGTSRETNWVGYHIKSSSFAFVPKPVNTGVTSKRKQISACFVRTTSRSMEYFRSYILRAWILLFGNDHPSWEVGWSLSGLRVPQQTDLYRIYASLASWLSLTSLP